MHKPYSGRGGVCPLTFFEDNSKNFGLIDFLTNSCPSILAQSGAFKTTA